MNKKAISVPYFQAGHPALVQGFAIRGCAILLALVVCALVTMLLTGENPISVYATILQGRLRHRPKVLGHRSRTWRSCWVSLWP